MSEVVFKPYVGPTYGHIPSRLLILGESHYGSAIDEDLSDATRDVVSRWISHQWAIRYLTVAGRLLTGQKAWEFDRARAFAPVAFYNFVQFLMPTASTRPTVAQANASLGAFGEVLANLDPTHVLVTGKTFLWNSLPPGNGGDASMTVGGMTLPCREYGTPSGAARVLVIPHLSRMSAPRWRPAVAEFAALPAVR